MIIIPSTPRLSTPARSATSSPAAASSSGVEAASTARMMASASPMSCPAMSRHQANSVEDERIAREHKEQQDALEDLGRVEWDAREIWACSAAEEVTAQNKPTTS